MKDKINSGESGRQNPEFEMRLAREIKQLDSEIMPSRNLWAGIERNMLDHPQKPSLSAQITKTITKNWMPYGIAASLVIGLVSLLLNVSGYSKQDLQFVASDHAIKGFQDGYLAVRNPLVDQFNQANKDLPPETLEDIYRNLEIISQARREIEHQVQEDPDNQRLLNMLMRIHEQELELLKPVYSARGRAL